MTNSPQAAICSAWSAVGTPYGAIAGVGIDLVDVEEYVSPAPVNTTAPVVSLALMCPKESKVTASVDPSSSGTTAVWLAGMAVLTTRTRTLSSRRTVPVNRLRAPRVSVSAA